MKNCISFLERISKLKNNELKKMPLKCNINLEVYQRSVRKFRDAYFFIGTLNMLEKYLWIIYEREKKSEWKNFKGEEIIDCLDVTDYCLKKCYLNHANASRIKEFFQYTNPVTLGICDTIGLGDRVGMAGPGQLRVVSMTAMRPVLAQQSIRELQRTKRSPDEVIDAAAWASFQEGFEEGFGADADHLQTKQDIDFMFPAGFTIYTIDPRDHVDNRADTYSVSELKEKVNKIPWKKFQDTLKDCLKRYSNRTLRIGYDLTISFSEKDLFIALVKYANAVIHTYSMYNYLKAKIHYSFEIEVSIDETDSVTTPFQHFFLVKELKRLGVNFVSLAPRFVGTFEKGVDYRGDLKLFIKEFQEHMKIAKHLGPYKISIHSASEKYSVFDNMRTHQGGFIHVKTTGTTYLVAMLTICKAEPELFREIFDFSRENFLQDIGTYHVSAKPEDVPESKNLKNAELLDLFDLDAARQVMYVPYGSVLTAKDSKGQSRFRDRINACLSANEKLHYTNISKFLSKHIPLYLIDKQKLII